MGQPRQAKARLSRVRRPPVIDESVRVVLMSNTKTITCECGVGPVLAALSDVLFLSVLLGLSRRRLPRTDITPPS